MEACKLKNGLLVWFLCFGGAEYVLAKNYGAAKSDRECKSDHEKEDHKYLSGEVEPLITTGSPEECDTPGCTDGFWGPRSRLSVHSQRILSKNLTLRKYRLPSIEDFFHTRFKEEPVCPKDLVHGLTKWMREKNKEGSDWAKKALVLQPCDLWKYMRGRTTWVIGDSVTEDVGHAMSAFMLEYWDKEHWEVSLSEDERVRKGLDFGASEGVRKGGKRVPYWCFQMGTLETPGRMCYIKADRLKRSLHVLNVLATLSQPEDIILINIGIHYNEMDDLEEDMTMLGYSLGNPALPKYKIWVETSPQHYETPTGMFNMSRPIKEQLCFPPGHFHGTELSLFADGSIGVAPGAHMPHAGSHKEISLQRLLMGGERNLATQPIVDAIGLTTLRTWNISLTLHEFHQHVHLPGEGECAEILCDCTHVCHPSWPQIAMASFPDIMESLLHKHSTR